VTGKQLKKAVFKFLSHADVDESLAQIRQLPGKKSVNALMSFFYSGETIIRWRAISAMGMVVADIAKADMESARVVMRRLMWNLNDESGGIGWGSPEAMGDIMARSGPLNKEYAHILRSYLNPAGNYLEHEMLQRGVLWGHGRLAHARPQSIEKAAPFISPFLKSHDPIHRGLAAWTLAALDRGLTESERFELAQDHRVFTLYADQSLVEYRLSDFVNQTGPVLTNETGNGFRLAR
jgi:hypothetical protein